MPNLDSDQWLSVIGRSLALLCMQATSEGRNIQQNALFLESLGLSRSDAAAMLGSSTASLTELHRRARNSKGRGRGTKKKTGRR
jgi:hypothetical protein